MLQPHHSIETADSESLSSYDRDSLHSTSTAGHYTSLYCTCTCLHIYMYTYTCIYNVHVHVHACSVLLYMYMQYLYVPVLNLECMSHIYGVIKASVYDHVCIFHIHVHVHCMC